jgi:hypothetical protein
MLIKRKQEQVVFQTFLILNKDYLDTLDSYWEEFNNNL